MDAYNTSEKFSPAQVADEFVQLAERCPALSRPDTAKQAVTDIFGIIRKCLTFEDSLEFINFLPLPLKAVYLDGWQVGNASRTPINSLEELIDEIVMSPQGQRAWYGSNRDTLREILKALFDVIGNHVGSHVNKPELSFLPSDIQYFMLQYHTEANKPAPETSIWLS